AVRGPHGASPPVSAKQPAVTTTSAASTPARRTCTRPAVIVVPSPLPVCRPVYWPDLPAATVYHAAMPDDRPPYEDALRTGQVVARLAAFDPHVVGTLPLGLAVAGSDIDIVCHAPDVEAFAAILASGFSGLPGFSIHRWI